MTDPFRRESAGAGRPGGGGHRLPSQRLVTGGDRRARRQEGLADAVVFNTCAVTAEAVRQARQAIRKVRRERPGARLIVTGCAAQIDPGAFAAMDEVDLVLGNAEKSAPGALTDGGARVRVGDIMAPRVAAADRAAGFAGRARAYVEIQNGCDHRCTFCVIPFGRGNARSSTAGVVVNEVRRLALAGYAEVVLTGVDLTSWGCRLLQRWPWALVAQVLAEVPRLTRLRLSSIDAAEIDPHLMTPDQASRGSADAAPASFPAIRRRPDPQADEAPPLPRPGPGGVDRGALPGRGRRSARPDRRLPHREREAASRTTSALVEDVVLRLPARLSVQPPTGDPAARMPQLPREVVLARARRLRMAGQQALARHLDGLIGRRAHRPCSMSAGCARGEDRYWRFRRRIGEGGGPDHRRGDRQPRWRARRGGRLGDRLEMDRADRRAPMRRGSLHPGRPGPRQHLPLPHVPEGAWRILRPAGLGARFRLDPGRSDLFSEFEIAPAEAFAQRAPCYHLEPDDGPVELAVGAFDDPAAGSADQIIQGHSMEIKDRLAEADLDAPPTGTAAEAVSVEPYYASIHSFQHPDHDT